MEVLKLQSKLAADTFALVTFAFAVGMFIEVVVSGLSVAQSLQSRLMAIPINMITARPYGAYRDWLFTLMRAGQRGGILKAAIDIAAFISFMLPQYALILIIAGANGFQVLSACATIMATSLIIGRSYGLYLGWCRGMFNVPVETGY